MSRRYTQKQKEQILELYEFGELNGLLNSKVPYESEDNPSYIIAEAEKVISKQSQNSRIIFGKDRMADIESGFGGIGKPNSNAIDIVVGMGSSFEPVGKRTLNKNDALDKNPFTDAARVYISQRTDLDGHFGITEGETYRLDSSQGVSGVAMKADTVLVLGRRNVKIKAGQSHGESMPRNGEKDAHGTRLPDARIDLIADAPLEPMVRGDKLVECIKNIYGQIRSNKLAILEILTQMTVMNTALTLHTHPNVGVIAINSPEMIANGVVQIPLNLAQIQKTIAESLADSVEELNCVIIPNNQKYILSKNVFTS